jgi:hypothetical protein
MKPSWSNVNLIEPGDLSATLQEMENAQEEAHRISVFHVICKRRKVRPDRTKTRLLQQHLRGIKKEEGAMD